MNTPAPAGGPILHLVMNAASGKGKTDEVLNDLRAELETRGRAHRFHLRDGAASLVDVAREAAVAAQREQGVVVAVGGDGTVNTVAAAALAAAVPLGVIPQGTFNYFAREHGVSDDPVAALRQVLDGEAQAVKVGLVNGRVFLVNASVGIYPQLLEDREAWKARFGRSRLVALLAGVSTMLRAQSALHLSYEVGGQRVRARALTLFVGNNRLQLQQLGLPTGEVGAALPAPDTGAGAPAPPLDEAQGAVLTVLTVAPVGVWRTLALLARGALGRLAEDDKVHSFTAAAVTLQRAGLSLAQRRIKVATDGETMVMAMPLRIEVAPQPLQLVKPRLRTQEAR